MWWPLALAFANTKRTARASQPVTTQTAPDDHKAYYPGARPIAIRVTGDKRTGLLLGAQLVGPRGAEVAKRVDTYAAALFHRMTVDDLSELDLSYTPPLGSPWDAVQMAAQSWVRDHQLPPTVPHSDQSKASDGHPLARSSDSHTFLRHALSRRSIATWPRRRSNLCCVACEQQLLPATSSGVLARMMASCMPGAASWVNVTSASMNPAAARPVQVFAAATALRRCSRRRSRCSARSASRQVVLGDDVGDPDPAAGHQNPEHLGQHRRLVHGQVDHAVGDHDVDGASRAAACPRWCP